MAAAQPTPGHWTRLRGCTCSETCEKCADSDDTVEAALRRQVAAAGGPHAFDVAPRRVVCTFASDMKGLMQICGHAGPAASWNCLLCNSRLNQTSQAGVPCLLVLPEPWRSQDKRPTD